MTRFDLPRPVQTFLTAAIENGILDATGIFVLGANHGDDWNAMMDEVMEIAFADFHSDTGRAAHAAMCQVNDATRAALRAA